ncbi:MAG: regulatory protein RepA [Candidatus Atribacteria bacterium]|nr:regulatory protein RepA [Candidatus Atribacteria bacterium]
MSSQIYSPKAKEVGISPTLPLVDATIEAEVLSSVVLSQDPEKLKQLHLRDFIFPETKQLYRILRQMAKRGEPIDLSSVLRHCVEKGMERETTLEILNSSPTATLFQNQLYRLKELSNKREVLKFTEKLNQGKITIEQFKHLTQKLDAQEGNSLPEPLPPEELFTNESIVSILGNFLFRGALHLLSSDPGVGKTTFLYHLAVSLAEGREFLSEELIPLRVAYFDLETPKALRSNLLQLLEFQGGENLFFFDEACSVESLKSLVKNYKVGLIIIDTKSLFFPLKKEDDNSENNSKVVKPLKELIREVGVSVIISHHNSKGSKERSKVYKSRGASALPGGCDVVINLELTEEDEIRKLEVVKNRLTGYMPKLYLHKEEGELSIVERPDSEYTRTQKAEEEILTLLKEERKLTAGELIEKIGAPRKTFYRALENLLTTGRVEKIIRGIYQLKNKKFICEIDDTNDTKSLKPAPYKAYNLCQPFFDGDTNDTNNVSCIKELNFKENEISSSLENKERNNLPKNSYSDTSDTNCVNPETMTQTMTQSQSYASQGFEAVCVTCVTKNAEKNFFSEEENSSNITPGFPEESPPSEFRGDPNCLVCNHPRREEIEYLFDCGITPKRLSEKYGVSISAIYDHTRFCVMRKTS